MLRTTHFFLNCTIKIKCQAYDKKKCPCLHILPLKQRITSRTKSGRELFANRTSISSPELKNFVLSPNHLKKKLVIILFFRSAFSSFSFGRTCTLSRQHISHNLFRPFASNMYLTFIFVPFATEMQIKCTINNRFSGLFYQISNCLMVFAFHLEGRGPGVGRNELVYKHW